MEGEKYRILLIGNDEQVRDQIIKAAGKEQFSITESGDGKEGLEIFKNERQEIIISDLEVPGIGGLEVAHYAKRIWPHVQVILIASHGSSDTVLSALREGVLDYINKPLDVNELELALGRAKENVAEYTKTRSFPTLLLAEDEASILKCLSRVLQRESWRVITAVDGEDAMSIFEKEKIDIVLTDIRMPKMDGLTLLCKMREITDDFESVVITAFGDEPNIVTAMRAGAVNFLRKPIDLDQLIVVVQKALEKLNLNRSLKYRTRELELVKKLISGINTDGK